MITKGSPWATLRRFHLTILRVCRHVMPPRLVRNAYQSASYNPVLRNLSSYYINTKLELSNSSLILLIHSPLRCESTSVTWGL